MIGNRFTGHGVVVSTREEWFRLESACGWGKRFALSQNANTNSVR